MKKNLLFVIILIILFLYLQLSGTNIISPNKGINEDGDSLYCRIIGQFNTTGSAIDVYVLNDYAYIADGNNGLRIIDVSDLTNPSEVGYYDTGDYACDLYITNDYAYVADGTDGLRIIDISDPTSPSEIGYYITGGFVQKVQVQNNYAYIIDENGLHIIDISDPTSPSEIGYYYTDDVCMSAYIYNNYAYIGDLNFVLYIVDISDPTVPKKISSLTLNDYIRDIYADSIYVYIANGNSGLCIIDVSDTINPSKIGSYDTDGYAQGVYVLNDYAYIADGGAGLRIIDLYDITNLVEVGYYDTYGNSFGVYVTADYIYVADYSEGMYILEEYVPVIRIINPNGEEICYAGDIDTIKWFSNDTVDVVLSYSVDNGNTWTLIDTVANTGEYSWTVSSIISDSCLIKGELIGYNNINDISDGVFKIYPLGIVYPKQNDYFMTGTDMYIEWFSYIDSVYAMISYTLDGYNWYAIKDSTANNTIYVWHIPKGISGDSAKIKITLTDGFSKFFYKESHLFKIGLIDVESPNGGEVYKSGDICNITWYVYDKIRYVGLYYSLNNGIVWEPIEAITTNDGFYQWVVPDTISDSVIIKIVDYEDSLIYDISDNVFGIEGTSGIKEKHSILKDYINVSSINKSSIEIKYGLKKNRITKISIYDISGRKVKEEKKELKSGTHNMNITIKSGIYMIKIEDDKGNIILSKKIIVIN